MDDFYVNERYVLRKANVQMVLQDVHTGYINVQNFSFGDIRLKFMEWKKLPQTKEALNQLSIKYRVPFNDFTRKHNWNTCREFNGIYAHLEVALSYVASTKGRFHPLFAFLETLCEPNHARWDDDIMLECFEVLSDDETHFVNSLPPSLERKLHGRPLVERAKEINRRLVSPARELYATMCNSMSEPLDLETVRFFTVSTFLDTVQTTLLKTTTDTSALMTCFTNNVLLFLRVCEEDYDERSVDEQLLLESLKAICFAIESAYFCEVKKTNDAHKSSCLETLRNLRDFQRICASSWHSGHVAP